MKRMTIAVAGIMLLVPALASTQSGRGQGPRYVNAPTLASPSGYSHAVVVEHGKVVYLAGQVALNAKGELVGAGDFRAQAVQAFENLRLALAVAGGTPAQLVKLNYYVVGLNREKLGRYERSETALLTRVIPQLARWPASKPSSGTIF